jgi:SAM-dependent methyltransferase
MSASAPEIPPPLALFQILSGKWGAQAVAAAAELGLADHLSEAPRAVAEVATECGFNELNLYRLMRALATLGVLVEHDGRRFSLSPVGVALRRDSGHPFGVWSIMLGSDFHNLASSGLADGVRTGQSPFRLKHGKTLFDWLLQQPKALQVFNDAMSASGAASAEAAFSAYDFSPFKRIADVGGGHGQFLARVLQSAPGAHGVLFDLPEVVNSGAKNVLEQAGVAARCEVIGGSFFESVPAGCDAYLLKYIIHDWDDERSVKILRNCASALAPNGRVLILDMVVPPNGVTSPVGLIDLETFIMTEGRERTEAEFSHILSKAGLKLNRIVPTPGFLSVIETVPT